ncbi:MAG: S1 RNA-binding domain-containing protein [bacterium]|nr:S1 RNA-binding domain-containing protein [bacterium]
MMTEDFFKEKLNASISNLNVEFKPGTKVSGEIIAIDRKSIFVDINSKSEGIINREELVDKEGNLTVKVGDKIEAYFVSDRNSEISLTVKMTGSFIAKHLEEAYQSSIPVEGKIADERKGGYFVKVANKEAFCPYSQVDLYPKEPENYIGNTYSFIITEMNRFNIVVSRRKLLEQEKVQRIGYLQEHLKENDIISGTVLSIKDFGVFVDLDGCEGFIPISELTWGHVEDPNEIVKTGDRIKVAVKKLDWTNNRITLSFRSAQTPWDEIAEKYQIGTVIKAKITRLATFGAFAELEKGIEGLIHISKLDPGRRLNHAKDAVKVGEIIPVVVENIDIERQRIALSRDFSGNIDSDDASQEFTAIETGMGTVGTVEGIKAFGIFVRLNPVQTGLLHISEIKDNNSGELSLKELSKKYPLGSTVSVVIKSMKDGKISLSRSDNLGNSEDAAWRDFSKKKSDKSFGTSLSDAFDGLDL